MWVKEFCGSFLETLKENSGVCLLFSFSTCFVNPLLGCGTDIYGHEDKGWNLRGSRVVSGREPGSLKTSRDRTITLALDCKLYMTEEWTSIFFESLGFLSFTEELNPSGIFPIAPESTPEPTDNKRSPKAQLTFRPRPHYLPPCL